MRRVGLVLFVAAATGLTLGVDGRSAGQGVKQAPKAAPAAPAAQKANAAADDAMLQQVEQQYGKYLRQIYRSELHFVRVVAEPTKPQFEKISADGEAAVKTAARTIALSMRGRRSQEYDPRAAMTEAIGKSVTANLS